MKYYYLLFLLIILSCKKNNSIELCETGSSHKPFANRLGIERRIEAKKISFKINGKPLSLNCPDLEDNYYFSLVYMILPDYYYGMLHSFTLRIRIPNYPIKGNLAYIYLNIYQFAGAGKYPLEHQFLPSGRQNITELKIEGDPSKPYYYVQRRSYGWLDIQEFDLKTFIIKGTFELDFVNDKNYSDTIKIREGVFDGRYIKIN